MNGVSELKVAPLFVTTLPVPLVSSAIVPEVLTAKRSDVPEIEIRGLVGTLIVAPEYTLVPLINLKLVMLPGKLSPVGFTPSFVAIKKVELVSVMLVELAMLVTLVPLKYPLKVPESRVIATWCQTEVGLVIVGLSSNDPPI